MYPLILGATAAAIGAALLTGGRAEAAPDVHYRPDEDAPFGPYHINRRPKGLPTVVIEARRGGAVLRVDGLNPERARAVAARAFHQRFKAPPRHVSVHHVREASIVGAGLPFVERFAALQGLGPAFIQTMVQLAKRESEGGTLGVAAHNFRASCRAKVSHTRRLCTAVDAPRSDKHKGVITAWGLFQWNRDHGRGADAHRRRLGLGPIGLPATWMPWDWTARQEVEVPIRYNADLWRLVKARGGSDLDAARGVRLDHTGPNRFARYLARNADAAAWARVNVDVRQRIDRHLREAGVSNARPNV